MEKLAGYVEHIIYRNTDNGYTVLNLVSGEDEITCVGIFSTIAEGENIEAAGDYTDHRTLPWIGCDQGNRACNGSPYCAEV